MIRLHSTHFIILSGSEYECWLHYVIVCTCISGTSTCNSNLKIRTGPSRPPQSWFCVVFLFIVIIIIMHNQCSPYLTPWSNTSYRLQLPEGLLKWKKYFLKYTFKMLSYDLIRFLHATRKWMNIRNYKVLKYSQLFFLWVIWKENIEERVQVLESIVLNSCVKVPKGDLHKIGLKMRE